MPELEPVSAVGSLPAIASSPSGILAVYANADHAVVGRLVGLNGVPLDIPFDIAPLAYAVDIAVAFDGSAFVVGWLDRPQDVSTLYFQRVSASGELLGDGQSMGPVTSREDVSFAMTEGASSALALLCAWRPGVACQTWLIDEAGPTTADLLPVAWDTHRVSLARSGDTLLAALDGPSNKLFLLRLDADGMFLDEGLVELASGAVEESSQAVVGTDTGFAILWTDLQNQRLSEVTLAGNITTRPAPLNADWIARPHALALSDGYLLVGDGGRDCGICPAYMRMRRYTAAWQPLGESLVLGRGSLDVTTIATLAGTAPFAMWENAEGALESRLLDVGADAVTGDPTLVSVKLPPQGRPRAAPGPGGSFLVMWNEWPRIRARRVDAAGVAQGDAFTLGEGNLDGTDVSGGPSGWLLTWNTMLGPQVAHVSTAGQLSEPVSLAGYGGFDARQKLARSDGGWLLAYAAAPPGEYARVTVSRFDDQGQLLDSQPLSVNPSSEWQPLDLTGSADGYEVWWLTQDQLWKAELSSGGQLLEPGATGVSGFDGRWISVAPGLSGPRLLLRTPEHTLFRVGLAELQLLSAGEYSELVNVGDDALIAWAGPAGAPMTPVTIGAEQNGVLAPLDTVAAARMPDLSTPAAGRLLLSMVREERAHGTWTTRVYTSVVTLDGAEGGGGQGGDGQGGDGQGQGQGGGAQGGQAGSETGATGDSGAGEGGRADTSGMPNGGQGAEGGAAPVGASPHVPRSSPSSGCGCSWGGQPAAPHWLGLLLLIALRRQRRAQFATR